MPIDDELLRKALDRVATSTTDHRDVGRWLTDIVEAAAGVFPVAGVGLMVLDPQEVLRYVMASDDHVRALEEAQEDAGQGPCIDSLVHCKVVATTDARDDERWPRLAPLLEGTAVHAVLGVPLVVSGNAIGTLNAYADEPHEWHSSEEAAIAKFAEMAAELVRVSLTATRQGQLAEQLQYALDHRLPIERAVGIVMASEGLGAVEAFDRLRRQARSRGMRVADLAVQVLGAHEDAIRARDGDGAAAGGTPAAAGSVGTGNVAGASNIGGGGNVASASNIGGAGNVWPGGNVGGVGPRAKTRSGPGSGATRSGAGQGLKPTVRPGSG